jgi:hypothetical protein
VHWPFSEQLKDVVQAPPPRSGAGAVKDARAEAAFAAARAEAAFAASDEKQRVEAITAATQRRGIL